MNLSDPSDEEASNDGYQLAAAKRPRTDTFGASSTTSHGSALQESEEEQLEDEKNCYNLTNNLSHTNARHLKEPNPEKNVRLNRSSVSENCSSPNELYEDYRPGFGDLESTEDTGQVDFQSSKNNTKMTDNITIQGEYSDKAQRMMSNMGFKLGKGLGKFEHGRVDPVETSNQKGRRGLGLQPSIVGDIPRNFKWSAEESEAEAKEDVTWMESSPSEPLTKEILEEWLKKGPKKLSIEDEIEFIDEDILKGVLNAKNIFDSLDEEELRHARARSNPYESIGAVIFLNRAAVKMANIDAIYDFMFTNPKNQNNESVLNKNDLLYFADVCAGPGGFSEYVLYRKGWRAKGFGFTLRNSNDFKLSDFYAGPPETFNPHYGAAGDGDVFNPANLAALRAAVRAPPAAPPGVHFLMADGGFSVEGRENLQEILSKQLYLCQCLAALQLLRPGGHFVVKLFDIFTSFSVGLVYLMYRCFDRVSIHKPVTSRPANSERYLVCKWKREDTSAAEQHLFSVNSFLWHEKDRDNDVTELVPLTVLKQDKAFYEYVYNSNCVLGEKQIKSLLKIAEFSKNKNLREKSQAEIKEQCLKLWQIPDRVRMQPERLGPDAALAAALCLALSSSRLCPPETSSPLAFKALLGKQPEYLQMANDLKVFKSVFDWHFMFLSSSRNSQDLRFFVGCGGKQVFQLEGMRWKNVVDLNITLPARTLIYGEIVKECRGEGGTQVHSKALHVLDALSLGGLDVSALPLTERHRKCAVFCAAIHKPFDPQALPIRCKPLHNMERLGAALGSLRQRAMKRVRRAVTVDVDADAAPAPPGEMFHVVGSLLFVKEIRDPWESRMSKSSGHKYYFGFGKDKKPRSEYYIPEEARLDMISSFTSRVMWPWEPASAVLEGGPHEGLTRAQMEEYVTNNVNR